MSKLQIGREMDIAVAKSLGCNVDIARSPSGIITKAWCGCKPPVAAHMVQVGDMILLGNFSTSDADALAALKEWEHQQYCSSIEIHRYVTDAPGQSKDWFVELAMMNMMGIWETQTRQSKELAEAICCAIIALSEHLS